MALAISRPSSALRRRALRSQARPTLALALAIAAAHFCWSSLSFASLLTGRPQGGVWSFQDTVDVRGACGCTSRTPRAARGGKESEGFTAGDKVKAISPDDDRWYPGTFEKANDDGTILVKWDDPDGGPEMQDVAIESVKKVFIFKDYQVGDDVQAISPADDRWYPGSVVKINNDGTFQVKWDDPDGGPETNDLQPDSMKKVTVFKDYKVDDVVEALFPEDNMMYAAKVTKVNDDGTFVVKWDDPDGGPEESTVKAKEMKYPPIPFDKLKVGQKYKGIVKDIVDFGAFVDIGSGTVGLIHISRISTERVENVDDYLEEGQEVDVWIGGLRDDGKFTLTMVEGRLDKPGSSGRSSGDLEAFQGLDPEEWFEGVVANIAPFGAFVTVTLPDDRGSADGLVHISRIRDGFVENVEDELGVGQNVKVRVESVDMQSRRMSLSMKEGWGGSGGGGASMREPDDLTPFQSVSPDEWLDGKVARIATFGAFVTVTPPGEGSPADGLVHITQIRDGFVESVEDELEVGQEVKVRVQSVDMGKLSLSMKAAEY